MEETKTDAKSAPVTWGQVALLAMLPTVLLLSWLLLPERHRKVLLAAAKKLAARATSALVVLLEMGETFLRNPRPGTGTDKLWDDLAPEPATAPAAASAAAGEPPFDGAELAGGAK